MATYNLDIFDVEHFDFDIFSISSSESVYKVIYELNKNLSIDLQLQQLLDFNHKEGELFYFPLYTFFNEGLNIEFNLIENQTSFQPKETKKIEQNFDLFLGDIERTVRLLPELDKSDYFLIIKGDNRYQYNHLIFDAIKLNQNFITVYEIYLENLKDKKTKSNLLF